MNNFSVYDPKRVYEYIAQLNQRDTGISPEVLAAMAAGKMEINSKTIHIRKNIKGASNTIHLIETKQDEEQGIRNITGAQLPQDNYFFIEGVRMAFSRSEDADPKTVTDYSCQRDVWDPALYSGKFQLAQRGKKILEIENYLFTSEVKSQATAQEEMYVLPDLRYLLPQQKIEMSVVFGEGLTVGNDANLEVSLIGRQLEVKVI